MASRRKFIKSASLAAASAVLIKPFQEVEAKGFNGGTPAPGHVVLSTWKFGMPANMKAVEILNADGKAVDAVQQAVMLAESDKSNTSVGLSGFPDRDGHVTLDACIMDEEGNAGSVTFLEGIEHPVAVARMVMDLTPHIMLSGEGAQQFATQHGFVLRSANSEEARQAWEKWKQENGYTPPVGPKNHDTIGLIVRTASGKIAGACSTSGIAFKMHGRVGDSPIIGAGLFIDPEIGAAAATGNGEAVMKICGTHTIVEMMRQGVPPQQACIEAMKRIVYKQKNYKDIQVGFIAVNRNGEYGGFGLQKDFQYALYKDGKNQLMDAPFLVQEQKK